MQISELKKDSRKVSVQGVIIEASEPRTVNYRAGGQGQVMKCILQDASGTIEFNVWNEDIPHVKKDSIISLEDGYVTIFGDKLQLNRGRYGKMTVQ